MRAEDVEQTLGVLVAAGHDPDRLLDVYSFEQLALFARCILSHQINMLNAILGPVSGALGADYEPSRVEGEKKRNRPRRPESHRNADYSDDEGKEAALLQALARSPIGVRTVKTSGDGG